MEIQICANKEDAGQFAAARCVEIIRQAIEALGEINIILATGASQFEMLSHLVTAEIDWSKVSVFHLDEYIGLPEEHPASFRRYLRERFVAHVSALGNFYGVNGNASDPGAECQRLAALLAGRTVSLACIGIGENGHLAFNDPPADFKTEEPFLLVNLDTACRQQQLGEGWFPTLDDVPRQAISMSIRQILKSSQIMCTVPDLRKANAVKKTIEGPVTNLVPASILQTHPACTLVLDEDSASQLQSVPPGSGTA
jgi:glucosamine-6-phosphate deaminase